MSTAENLAAAAPPPRAAVLRLPAPDALARSVVAVCADTYGIAASRIMGRGRSAHEALARQAACWCLRRAGQSLHAIGQSLGRDHATIVHAEAATEARHRHDAYLLARDLGVLDACGIPRPAQGECAGFVAGWVGNRGVDFAARDRLPTDMCQQPGCGRRRGAHR